MGSLLSSSWAGVSGSLNFSQIVPAPGHPMPIRLWAFASRLLRLRPSVVCFCFFVHTPKTMCVCIIFKGEILFGRCRVDAVPVRLRPVRRLDPRWAARAAASEWQSAWAPIREEADITDIIITTTTTITEGVTTCWTTTSSFLSRSANSTRNSTASRAKRSSGSSRSGGLWRIGATPKTAAPSACSSATSWKAPTRPSRYRIPDK